MFVRVKAKATSHTYYGSGGDQRASRGAYHTMAATQTKPATQTIAPKRARTRQGATQSAPALAAAPIPAPMLAPVIAAIPAPAPAMSLAEAVRTGYAAGAADQRATFGALGATLAAVSRGDQPQPFGDQRAAAVRARIDTLRAQARKPSLSRRLRARAPRWSLSALSLLLLSRLLATSMIKLSIIGVTLIVALAILFPSAACK